MNEFDNFVATSIGPRDTHPGAPTTTSCSLSLVFTSTYTYISTYRTLGMQIHHHLLVVSYIMMQLSKYHLYKYIRPLQLPCRRMNEKTG
jgi:hypothetical protein